MDRFFSTQQDTKYMVSNKHTHRNMLRNLGMAFLFVVTALNSSAQQDAIYSQYMFNTFAINPAYAGTRNSMSAVILHRSQWVGIDGAPTTQTATVHAPINKYNIAWGVNLAHDRLGPTRNILAAGTGAYHVKLRNAKISFALRAGIYNSILNKGMLSFKEDGDVFDQGGTVSALVPSFDAGVYYYKTKFFVGLSATHMASPKFKYEGYPSNTNMYLRTHVMLHSGYVFEFNRKFVLKPSVLIKSTDDSPFNVDVNISALLYKRVWLGLSVRHASSLNFLIDVNVTDYLRMGYAYDLLVNQLSQYSKGSHEVFIGFDFDIKKSQTISPRFL
ncbi:MAG: type IX secretion system membrane protein PorP/SprF [Crocinitomicaceae bacterium]|nr:type IX secretion system membrane protein PorP/SprF [Crocinitomicaceae bacterium]